VTIYGNWDDTNPVELNYMFECLDQQNPPTDQGPVYRYNGVYYQRSEEYSQASVMSGSVVYNLKAIEGMTAAASTALKKSGSGNSVSFGSFGNNDLKAEQYLFYKRTRHDVTFDANGGTLVGDGNKLTNVMYGAPITPPAQNPVRSEYEFDGWYMDAECNEPADFTKVTVPNSDIIFFAKWKPTAVKADFFYEDPNEADQYIGWSGALKGGNYASIDLPKIGESVDGYGVLINWLWIEPVTNRVVPFPFDAMAANNDITLFGSWLKEGLSVQ
jgi:uncharacterized repeat protein (TIGR02543 family)